MKKRINFDILVGFSAGTPTGSSPSQKKKGLLQRILSIFKKKDSLKDKKRAVIQIIQIVNDTVNSPVTEGIVKWTPWKFDDKLLNFLKDKLPLVLHTMGLSSILKPVAPAVYEAANIMRDYTKDNQSDLYKVMAGRLYQEIEYVPEEKAIIDIQSEYQEMKKEGAI